MSRFKPADGTIFSDLFDRCFQILDINHANTGEIKGYSLHERTSCIWSADNLLITVETPVSYGHDPRAPNLAVTQREVRSWPFEGTSWARTTGFLNLSRMVPKDAVSFKWIEPSRVARAFEIPLSPSTSKFAKTCLEYFYVQSNWMRPVLRSDWVFDYEKSPLSDPNVIRIAPLFQVPGKQMILWEIQNSTALKLFSYQPGFHVGDMNVLFSRHDKVRRLETLTFEFELSGGSSFDFKIA